MVVRLHNNETRKVGAWQPHACREDNSHDFVIARHGFNHIVVVNKILLLLYTEKFSPMMKLSSRTKEKNRLENVLPYNN